MTRITPDHLARSAFIYVRQSTSDQVLNNHAQGSGWPESELHRRSGLECRPGVIEIDLPDGARIRVDAFVNGRALARVLSALKRCR